MKGICPLGEKETQLEWVRSVKKIGVGGESIKVEGEYYKCKVCGKGVDDPRSEDDPRKVRILASGVHF